MLTVPTLLSPANGAVMDNGRSDFLDLKEWSFDWTDVAGADRYHLHVMRLGAGNPAVDIDTLTNSDYLDESRSVIGSIFLSDWQWRVRAHTSAGWNAWSEVRTFSAEPGSTDPPLGAEVSVRGNDLVIVDGSPLPSAAHHTDFGTALQGGSGGSRTFVVTNEGETPLTLGPVNVPAGFILTKGLATSLAARAFDTLIVRLDTASAGTKSGQISFATGDANENPFNFSVTGTVDAIPSPEVTVFGNQNIEDNDFATTENGASFGMVFQNEMPVARTFTVRNEGNVTLTLSNLSVPAGFTITEGLSASLSPGTFDTFTVQLNTETVGSRSGQISFNTNDSNENPFNFGVSGQILSPSWSVGAKSVLYIRVDFADRPGTPVSDAEVAATTTDAADFFEQTSNGSFSLSYDITPTLRLPQTSQWYVDTNFGQLTLDAFAAALALGYDRNNYWSYVIAFTSIPGAGHAGWANPGGPGVWLNGHFNWGYLAHELGHNLGLGHANSWEVAGSDPIGIGTSFEYGSPYSVMGSPPAWYHLSHQFHAFETSKLGWLDSRDVIEVTSSSTYRIQALDAQSELAGVAYALQVPTAGGRSYWVEFRPNYAWMSSGSPELVDSLQNGIVIYWDRLSGNFLFEPHVLDMTPGQDAWEVEDRVNSALEIGSTFTDPLQNITIRPVAKDAANGWIDVEVIVSPTTPEVTVLGSEQNVADNDSTPALTDDTDFGSVVQNGAAISRTFAVRNDGTATLTLSSLTVPTGFTITNGLVTSLAPGQIDTFTVRLDTTTVGVKTGQISFTTNDADENPFNFSITGAVTAPPSPEVTVLGGGQNIADDNSTPTLTDDTDFGSVVQGGATVSHSFTVRNDGNATLTLGSLVVPTGYTITNGLVTSLAPGQSDTFTVRLDATIIGVKTGQISFTTNDADESPFNFSITGVVIAPPTPEVTVLGNGQNVADNDPTPSLSDDTAFGSLVVGGAAVSHTFTVRNDGNATLALGSPIAPTGFTITDGLVTSLAPGQSDTFTVRLDTAAVGMFSGQISFTTNDADENPFNFSITGAVTAPTVTLVNGVAVTSLAGAVGSQRTFAIDVPENSSGLVFEMFGGSGDADLYVKFGSPPTTANYDYRPYLSGNTENVVPSSATEGTWYVMVHGYAAYAGVTVKASFTPGPAYPYLESLAKGLAYWSLDASYINAALPNGYDQLGFVVDRIFEDPNSGFYAIGLKSAEMDPVLVLRGTNFTSTLDWLSDGDSRGVGYSQFIAGWSMLSNWLSNDPDVMNQPIDIVGHSLGGALAQWVAAELTSLGRSIGEVVTFNSPGIAAAGSGLLTDAGEFVASRAQRVTHYIVNGDVVSLAGEQFIAGDFVAASFSDWNLINKHTKPILVSNYSRQEGGVVQGPENVVPGTRQPVTILNAPGFGYDDPDLRKWQVGAIIAFSALNSTLKQVPIALDRRDTTEALRPLIAPAVNVISGGLAALEWSIDAGEAAVNWTLDAGRVMLAIAIERGSDILETFVPSFDADVDFTVDTNDPQGFVFDTSLGLTIGDDIQINLPDWLGGDIQADHLIELVGVDASGRLDVEKFALAGQFNVLGSLLELSGGMVLTWADQSATLFGQLALLDGFLAANAQLYFNGNQLIGSGGATVRMPDSAPYWLLPGATLGSAQFLLNYVLNGSLADDYVAAWGSVGPLQLGLRMGFDGNFDLLNATEIAGLLPPDGGGGEFVATQQYSVDAGTNWILLTADWASVEPDAALSLITPGGVTLTEADIAALPNLQIIDELTTTRRRSVLVQQPAPGTWTLSLEAADPGNVSFIALRDVPVAAVAVQASAWSAGQVTIDYEADSVDPNARVGLYYSQQGAGLNGILIADGLATGTNSFTWSTLGVPAGDYHVYAVIVDEASVPAAGYAADLITIPGGVTAIAVTTFDDVVDAYDGLVSLREAILHVNADRQTAYQIHLETGTYTLSMSGANEDAAATGDLDVLNTAGVTITGAGMEDTILEAGGATGLNDRVFQLLGDGKLTLEELEITGGSADRGGGIYNSGNLTMTGVGLSHNSAARFGGALFNVGAGSTAILTNSRLLNNSAHFGGGIDNHAGSLVITDSVISQNSAFMGGGVFNVGGEVSMTHGSLWQNAASMYGGGLFNANAAGLSVTDVAISQNSSAFAGGGVFNAGLGATAVIEDSSLADNTAALAGAGNVLNLSPASLQLINTTITDGGDDGGGGEYTDDSNGDAGIGPAWEPSRMVTPPTQPRPRPMQPAAAAGSVLSDPGLLQMWASFWENFTLTDDDERQREREDTPEPIAWHDDRWIETRG